MGLTKSRRRYCNTTCMCRLSLAWVTSENSTMLLESDSSWLTFAGPYPMLPRLSAVQPQLPFLLSSHQLLSWSPANSAVRLSPVQPQLPFSGPATNCQLSGSRRQLSFASPYHFRIRRDFFVQESFVWFRAKTDSSALAAYPHSATVWSKSIRTEMNNEWNINFFQNSPLAILSSFY